MTCQRCEIDYLHDKTALLETILRRHINIAHCSVQSDEVARYARDSARDLKAFETKVRTCTHLRVNNQAFYDLVDAHPVHFLVAPGKVKCGADEPNMPATDVILRVTCRECIPGPWPGVHRDGLAPYEVPLISDEMRGQIRVGAMTAVGEAMLETAEAIQKESETLAAHPLKKRAGLFIGDPVQKAIDDDIARKTKESETLSNDDAKQEAAGPSSLETPKRKRGRPRKVII